MAKFYGELITESDVNNLAKLTKYEIDRKFKARLNIINKEFKDLIENQVFSDQEIPYVEDQIRVDYLGLSSMSIGVISLLIGDELNIEAPGEYDDPDEENEMKESLLTAKIEAIAANTEWHPGRTSTICRCDSPCSASVLNPRQDETCNRKQRR